MSNNSSSSTTRMSKYNPDPDYFKYDPEALRLFHYIMKRIECKCNKNEVVDRDIFEPCFACQKVGDLIEELDKEWWII